MPEPELFLLFVRPLNRAGIRYVVSGSVAAIFYGEPRLTHDVDFIIFLNANDCRGLSDAFPEKDFYLPPMETILAETAREKNGHFNLIHRDTGFKADMYPTGRDELNAWAFGGKRAAGICHCSQALILSRRPRGKAFARHPRHACRVGRTIGLSNFERMDSAAGLAGGMAAGFKRAIISTPSENPPAAAIQSSLPFPCADG
jgi:hypothetical protein